MIKEPILCSAIMLAVLASLMILLSAAAVTGIRTLIYLFAEAEIQFMP